MFTTFWLVRNSKTPSLAITMNLSCLFKALERISGSAMTPSSSETESPILRVNAVPYTHILHLISILMMNLKRKYFRSLPDTGHTDAKCEVGRHFHRFLRPESSPSFHESVQCLQLGRQSKFSHHISLHALFHPAGRYIVC
jgi:hypothetical protein